MTKIAVGLAKYIDGFECGRAVAQDALSQIAPPYSLALLFTSHPNPKAVLQGVNSILPKVPLIGSTSMGEYTHKGYVEGGAGLMLIQSDQLHFNAVSRRPSWFKQRLFGHLQGTSKEGFGDFSHRTLMLFPDNHSMNLDKLVEKAISETAMLYNIVGGASPAPPKQTPTLFLNHQMISSGLVGTELLSEQAIGLALANGWSPISQPYRVTKSDERYLIKLDGRPVREVYEDFFLDQGYPLEELESRLPYYPIGICEHGECKVSIPMLGFEENGALRVTSPPTLGSLVYILSTKPDVMVHAAQRAIQTALVSLNQSAAAGALFIDCMSTSILLHEAYEQQRIAVQTELGDIPFLGFRSHGVLARLQGQTNGHYECSVAACILPS